MEYMAGLEKQRGVQKSKEFGKKDNSITHYLEESLLSLSPSNTPVVYSASRTDAGVHSCGSAFHASLCLPPLHFKDSDETEEFYITSTLNTFFENTGLEIRILRTQIVPDEFHCRSAALEKTYLYRIASTPQKGSIFPLLEINRALHISGDINFSAIHCACEILKGTHDFRYYAKRDKKKELVNTVRELTELKIVPGSPSFPPKYDKLSENLKIWNIFVTSKGFLYNQVRRIVGVLLGVGSGRIKLKEVEETLSNPLKQWSTKGHVVMPSGLYLLNIKLSPEAVLGKSSDDSQAEGTNIKLSPGAVSGKTSDDSKAEGTSLGKT